MNIPEDFIDKTSSTFGQSGEEWISKLPEILGFCQDKWQLTHIQPVENLSINLICFAQSKFFGHVVLKLQAPHSERRTELTALQLFAGRKVCQLLAFDQEAAALLLERILPGDDLRSLPEKGEQLEIGADLVSRLPLQVSSNHSLPSYRTWITNAFDNILPQSGADDQLSKLMHTAGLVLDEIYPPGSPSYLLHGDLHHDNILRSHQKGWKIIDPQGVIGLPFMEAARFIQNHIMKPDHTLNFDQLDETASYFAWRLGQSESLILRAFFILHALDTCWDLEMKAPQGQIETQIHECNSLLEFLQRANDMK
jgi:streptomycin 6-kinase